MSNVVLPTYYQQFIHKSRYARWLDDEQRREEWHETVSRYFDYYDLSFKDNIDSYATLRALYLQNLIL